MLLAGELAVRSGGRTKSRKKVSTDNTGETIEAAAAHDDERTSGLRGYYMHFPTRCGAYQLESSTTSVCVYMYLYVANLHSWLCRVMYMCMHVRIVCTYMMYAQMPLQVLGADLQETVEPN